jgi:hypothetical protein
LFPGVSHKEYLDDITIEEREWMLRIHQVVKMVEAEKERQAANG